jgi:geranylgeranyl diphosphate synthase type II
MKDIKSYVRRTGARVEKALRGYLPPANAKPRLLHTAMRYSVLSQGKRIRPVVAIASFEACGGRGDRIMPAACGIEVIHTYTLIHDDLPSMDNDDYRRGRLSSHKRFGDNIALLAGDALLTLGFQLLAESGDVDLVREVAVATGSRGTVGGQVVDIKTPQNRLERELDYITLKKTAALFEAAALCGAMLAGAKAEIRKSIARYGRFLGIAFQLVDDIFDSNGYAAVYRKEDIKNMAQDVTDKAMASLVRLGSRAVRLREIAGLILNRKS